MVAATRGHVCVLGPVLALVLGSCSAPELPQEPGAADPRDPAVTPVTLPETVLPPTAEVPAPPPTAEALAPPASRPIPGLEEAERLVLDATNAARVKRGLAPLAAESTLRQAARAHSADMIARGFFSHDNPDGASPSDRVSHRHRRLVGLTGENIWTGSGYGSFPSGELARTIIDGWMSSPGHRGNILKPEYTHLGVGIVSIGDQVRATQSFAEICGLTARPVPATVARGGDLRPGAVSGPKGRAAKFDLFSPRRGVKIAGPFDLEGASIDAAPGSYQLRFYFPDGPRSYSIYYGPRIEVR